MLYIDKQMYVAGIDPETSTLKRWVCLPLDHGDPNILVVILMVSRSEDNSAEWKYVCGVLAD